MTLTKHERDALGAAEWDGGVSRSDSSWYRIGDKTISDLVGRGLLEEFPHPVTGEPRYWTTPAGAAALTVPPEAKPKSARRKIEMLKPRVAVLDTRIGKPRKG
jgi:hypothetical protein